MALSEAEKKQLKDLEKKRDAPDPPKVNKSVSITVDPKDKDSVAFAIKHGFLTADEVEEQSKNGDSDDDSDDDDDADKKKPRGRAGSKTPRRRGYFD